MGRARQDVQTTLWRGFHSHNLLCQFARQNGPVIPQVEAFLNIFISNSINGKYDKKYLTNNKRNDALFFPRSEAFTLSTGAEN